MKLKKYYPKRRDRIFSEIACIALKRTRGGTGNRGGKGVQKKGAQDDGVVGV